MDFAYELNCFIEDKGQQIPFSLKISKPFRPKGSEEEYHCLVYVPLLFGKPKRIAGIDERQAIELSKRFVEILIEGKNLFDKDGNQLAINIQ